MKQTLTIIKTGGKIVEEQQTLQQLLTDFAAIPGHKALIHGGGRSATKIAAQLGIETQMINGRRITDKKMLDVVTMVYAGLVNKNIVAQLQAHRINALGLTGADINIIHSHKRPVTDIDYGYVGDVDKVDGNMLTTLIHNNIVPVIAPLTHDGQGHMLNTNADTIAAETAKVLAPHFEVTLIYCFEKPGVLLNPDDDNTLITHINPQQATQLITNGNIEGGMIPKLQNAFNAIHAGVKKIIITNPQNINGKTGTTIQA